MPRCHTFCCLLCNSCLIFIIIIFLFALFTQYKKNLFTVVIARRQGDPESHWAYGRATSLTLINKVKKKCCECAARLLHFRLKTKKVWRTSDWNRKRVPNFRTLVKNCKLLEICAAQMRSTITSCSGTIVVNLAIRYKKIERESALCNETKLQLRKRLCLLLSLNRDK